MPAQDSSSQVKREEALCVRGQRGLEERAIPTESITGEWAQRLPKPGRERKGPAGFAGPHQRPLHVANQRPEPEVEELGLGRAERWAHGVGAPTAHLGLARPVSSLFFCIGF